MAAPIVANIQPAVATSGVQVVATGVCETDTGLSAEIDTAPKLQLPRPQNQEARLELGSAKTLNDGRTARSVLFRAYVRDTRGKTVRTRSGKSYKRKSTYVARVYNINSIRELKAHLS